MAPLAIDLCCGLVLIQAEFYLGGDAAIQQFVTRRAENPYHMGLTVLHLSPYAVSSMLWSMCQLKDSRFSARLTGAGQFRVFAAHTSNDPGIPECAPRVIHLLYFWVLAVKSSSLFLRRHCRAFIRAVTTIAVRRDDREMLAANPAISATASYISLFVPTQTSSPRLTFERTVTLVRTLGWKLDTTTCTE